MIGIGITISKLNEILTLSLSKIFQKPSDIVKLERELSTVLGRKVDLLTEAAISPYMRDTILRVLKVINEN